MIALRPAGVVAPAPVDVAFAFVFAGAPSSVPAASGFGVAYSTLPLGRYSRAALEGRLATALAREFGEGVVLGGERYSPRVSAVSFVASQTEFRPGLDVGVSGARISFRYIPQPGESPSLGAVSPRVAAAVASLLQPSEAALGSLAESARTGNASGQWRVTDVSVVPVPAAGSSPAPAVPPSPAPPVPAAPTPAAPSSPAAPASPRVVAPAQQAAASAAPVLALLVVAAAAAAVAVVVRSRATAAPRALGTRTALVPPPR